MNVTGIVEEEEARTGEWVVGFPGDFDDSDVVVARFEFGDCFDFIGWDSVVVVRSFVAVSVGV